MGRTFVLAEFEADGATRRRAVTVLASAAYAGRLGGVVDGGRNLCAIRLDGSMELSVVADLPNQLGVFLFHGGVYINALPEEFVGLAPERGKHRGEFGLAFLVGLVDRDGGRQFAALLQVTGATNDQKKGGYVFHDEVPFANNEVGHGRVPR
ncbi:hypothetical protein ACSBOB_09965 [Mesorhizobium sp. ASY16-5R]|uniref:hypothetical protein n=1 Tax=Mesorhizobium sp. ASY16-5R TaxID=3445772 RepID=UPI003F9F5E56